AATAAPALPGPRPAQVRAPYTRWYLKYEMPSSVYAVSEQTVKAAASQRVGARISRGRPHFRSGRPEAGSRRVEGVPTAARTAALSRPAGYPAAEVCPRPGMPPGDPRGERGAGGRRGTGPG